MPERMLSFWDRIDPDTRIAATSGSRLLLVALALTRDPDIGLRAALQTGPGDYDLLEYAASSCTTVREALEVMSRYLFLISDKARLDYEIRGSRLYLYLSRRPTAPTRDPTDDFALAFSYLSHRRWIEGDPSHLEVWFPYPKPEASTLHDTIFDPRVKLTFGAPCCALISDAADLELRPRASDPKLNDLLLRFAQSGGPVRPSQPSFVDLVRRATLGELHGGDPSAEHIAELLTVSRRTLVRRLEEAGVSFKDLLSHVRCTRAVHYLLVEQLSTPEIVERLGYSDRAAFSKAFKRWFGVSPIQFVRARTSQDGRLETPLAH